ncbi:MAG: hypothetical protein A2Z20_10270 [Bdellovibrionales bacterium RBG_16_40_8]|nr:MAG: hypothetical protein A2Z20_10270 [Bdellovibrionales bacterium RBG_16_40_8]
MYLEHFLKRREPNMTFDILGTDINNDSIKFATNGVYRWDEIKEMPLNFLSENWARGTGEIAKYARIKNNIKKKCRFLPLNLMRLSKGSFNNKFDIIFCRNVFIYFSQDTINKLVSELCHHLEEFGFFFVGLSESLSSSEHVIKRIGPSIYGFSSDVGAATQIQRPLPFRSPKPAEPIRVFCVDDYGVILSLLANILKPENGFKVVGTAINGKEAAEKLKSGLKADVMTLDIHMPEMNGIEYLQAYMNSSHIPVVMVTSVSRDNMDIAYKALELGAKDYIEKPSLNNLNERADEIRFKLKYAYGLTKANFAADLRLDKEFESHFTVKNIEEKLRVLYFDYAHIDSVLSALSQTKTNEPATILVYDREDQLLTNIQQKLQIKLNKSISLVSENQLFSPDSLYLTTKEKFITLNRDLKHFSEVSYMILAHMDQIKWQFFYHSERMQIILDEYLDRSVFAIDLSAVIVCPVTSFYYMSYEFFAKKEKKVA